MKKYSNDKEAVDDLRQSYYRLTKEIGKVIIGQDQVIKEVIIAILSNGHGLLVGVPGLAKTLLVNTIAQILGLKYNRIQFTPDLMPSDIIGTEILDSNKNFKFIKGPLFANILLADEINRTPPKTQSALLEAMQERAVTTAGVRYKLDRPFFVLATQNPIEQEGTYPLPEAQLDRFMFNINVSYPSVDEEIEIVRQTTGEKLHNLEPVVSKEEILSFQDLIRRIPVNHNVLEYAVNIAAKSRPGLKHSSSIASEYLVWGAGPRASQYLILGAKTHAVLNGKYSPDIEDIKAITPAILRHRLVKNYKAEAAGVSIENIIDELLV
ncbi:MAG: MoxR family ATPase [Bacteroidetes bacterium]|jgi:MoxR-like ATPase|nr:MoxR family ATPase [Bacteroidota bacterium]MBT3749198.1 MoxR family ATPase [Bacteroidota bacterium]MBT4399775.1 MoxR family ATPase [Bacteroidota bacterium]MBT4410322.1 MoxR family ATPase [Bacteroidota bacterium]MBT5426983.1 MoxR family ATPase [Bacteroidota bacterium]